MIFEYLTKTNIIDTDLEFRLEIIDNQIIESIHTDSEYDYPDPKLADSFYDKVLDYIIQRKVLLHEKYPQLENPEITENKPKLPQRPKKLTNEA